jgi:predicted acyltransferase (DUF342 family)
MAREVSNTYTNHEDTKMNHKSWLRPLIVAFIGISLFGSAYGHNVNKDIDVGDGISTKGQSTVNGSISVGSDAVISGSLNSVNGSIEVGDNSQFRDASVVNGKIMLGEGIKADDVDSVNGPIRIGKNASISGEISTVNGGIKLLNGSTVGQDVSNINGRINIEGTEIAGNLTTVTGDIMLTQNSVLQGDLVIEKQNDWGWGNGKESRNPQIVIGPGTKVIGKIIAKRDIDLFVSNSAEIGGVSGKISMDQAVRFNGDRP